jgi:hypothetical protein
LRIKICYQYFYGSWQIEQALIMLSRLSKGSAMDINEMKKIYTESAQQLNALSQAIAYLHQNIGQPDAAGDGADAFGALRGGRSALATRQQLARESLQRLQRDRNDLVASRKTVGMLIRQHSSKVRCADDAAA